jgi:two-component system, response regulator YesN
MYKLLIVDDDEIMREGIEKNIDWNANGFMVVATACNGLEGLEAIKEFSPDVVLSDIKMPFMDGLQMAEKINSLYPQIKVVLLTGYDDFQYAKKALNLKVSQYVLKYEDNDEILEALKRAGREFDLNKSNYQKIEKSKPLLINNFFSELLSGIQNEELLKNYASLLELSFNSNFFCTSVINLDSNNSTIKKMKFEDINLIMTQVQDISEELNCKQQFLMYFINYNGQINILFNFLKIEEKVNEYLKTTLEKLINNVKAVLKVNISIGVGNIYEGYKNIVTSYNEALLASDMGNVVGKGNIFFIDDVRNNENSHFVIMKKVMNYINKNYCKEELSLNLIADEVHVSSSYISSLFKKYNEINISDYIISIRMKKAMQLLINTDLKTYEISEKIGYSNPQYFSVLFKKHTGYSPMEYRNLNT